MVSRIDLKFTFHPKIFSRNTAWHTLAYTRAQTSIWGARNVRCTIVYGNMLFRARKTYTKISNSWSPAVMFIMWLQAMTLSYVISNDVFSWIPMVMSLSFMIYYVTICQAMFGISRLMHICSISSYFFKLKRTKSYVYPCVSLINQVFV